MSAILKKGQSGIPPAFLPRPLLRAGNQPRQGEIHIPRQLFRPAESILILFEKSSRKVYNYSTKYEKYIGKTYVFFILHFRVKFKYVGLTTGFEYAILAGYVREAFLSIHGGQPPLQGACSCLRPTSRQSRNFVVFSAGQSGPWPWPWLGRGFGTSVAFLRSRSSRLHSARFVPRTSRTRRWRIRPTPWPSPPASIRRWQHWGRSGPTSPAGKRSRKTATAQVTLRNRLAPSSPTGTTTATGTRPAARGTGRGGRTTPAPTEISEPPQGGSTPSCRAARNQEQARRVPGKVPDAFLFMPQRNLTFISINAILREYE